MLFSEIEQGFTALEIPFAPWCDDVDVGLQTIIAKLETHLIVTLAGGAVADRIGADLTGDFDLALGDQRTGDRGAEQVLAFIDRVGAEHREDVVFHELFADVLDEDVLGLDAGGQRLGARGFDLAALTEIGGEGDHFRIVLGLEPLEDNRGVETAGIGEDDFLDGLFRRSGHGELTLS